MEGGQPEAQMSLHGPCRVECFQTYPGLSLSPRLFRSLLRCHLPILLVPPFLQTRWLTAVSMALLLGGALQLLDLKSWDHSPRLRSLAQLSLGSHPLPPQTGVLPTSLYTQAHSAQLC